MSGPAQALLASTGTDPVLDNLIDEFAKRLQAGERVDVETFVHEHPERAEELCRLLPAMQVLAELGRSAAEGSLAETTSGRDRDPALGELGDYRILREVGRGGMGVVYEAEQISLNRRVALKVLPFAATLDAKQLQRFKNEAQAAACLHHTNIVPVFAVGCERGVHYYAMQFIDGQTLAVMIGELRQESGLEAADKASSTGPAAALAAEMLSGRWAPAKPGPADPQPTGPHPPAPETPAAPAADAATRSAATVSTEHSTKKPAFFRTVANLGVQAAEALEHAHALGVVHRDIKPANLLVDTRGNLWITDFGLAHCQSQAGLTMTGDLVGTLRYMSPEQALAQRVIIDHRTDIYSLGATLYELLTLESVFAGRDRQELLRQIAFDEPRPPRRLNKAVPAELETIVQKAMEKNPADRYATAQELADDLERFLKDESIRAKRPSLLQRARKWARRHQPIVWSVLIATVVVLLLAVGMLGLSYLRVHKAQQRTEEALEEKTELLWKSYLNHAQARRYSRQMGQRLDSLEALIQAARIRPDERLRDEAIAAMALPDVRRHGPSWNARPSGTKGIAFDGLYRLYARLDDKGVFSIRTIPDDREVQRIVSGSTTLAGPWLSPDGRFLAGLADLEEGCQLQVWRVTDGQPVICKETHLTWGLAFSPDGRQLAVGHKDGWVLRFDLTNGQELNRWRLPANAKPWNLAFHPDNRQLAVGYYSSTFASVYNAADGSRISHLPVGAIDEHTVAWHPDGRRLAVAGSDARIQIWDVAAERKLATLEGHVQMAAILSFHPDGGLLASSSRDGTLRLWHPSSGRQLMQLPLTVDLQFSTDRRWFGVERHGEQAQLLKVAPCPEYRTLVSDLGAGQGGYHFGDISPDGRLLAVGMDDGVRLWDLRSGRELAKLPGSTRTVFFDRIGPRWELLTSTSAGLLRWPAQIDDPEGPRLRLGPPRQLSPLLRADFARSAEGRTLAAVYEEETPIQILDLERNVVRQNLGLHPQGDGLHALSADGRWVASCGWHSDRVRLWSAGTGQMVHEWSLGERALVFFTPDSRALVISQGDEFSFWDVHTLEPIRRLRRDVAGYPGYVAFSPDGGLMAMEMAPAVIHLKEVATGRTVAKLEDPHGDRARWLGFTPDGTQLVTAANYARAIHVWDLRAIRRQLKGMRLDWDWPEFPLAAESGASRAPVAVTVDPGPLQKDAFPDPRDAGVPPPSEG
jgi:serine/threonine protein kinase/WD40 repeat protein